MKRFKQYIENPYILYTLLFLLVWGIITAPFVLRGNSLIGEADSYNQSYPTFVYVGEAIRSIFHGEFQLFDFHIGLGDDVITALNWHGLDDVFQCTSALFNKQNAEAGYTLVMVLKFYSAGMAFLVFADDYVREGVYKVAGALLYVFSVFVLFYGLNFWGFLVPMMTLPLILHGIHHIYEENGRIDWGYIIVIFIQTLTGFYGLYMEAFIAAVYLIATSASDLCGHRLRLGGVFRRALSALGQAIVGCMLAAFFLVPVIVGYLNSTRSGDRQAISSVKELFLFDADTYVRGITNLLIPEAYQSTVTLSAVTVLGLLLLVSQKQVHKEVKSATVVLVAVFWIPFFGRLMNGFSYWTDRWYYAVILFLSLSAIVCMEQVAHVNHGVLLAYGLLSAVSIIWNTLQSNLSAGVLLRNAVVMISVIILPFIWNSTKNRKHLLLIFTIGVVTMNGLFVFGPTTLGGSGYSAGFKEKEETYTEISESVVGVKDIVSDETEFERWDVYGAALNSSLVMGFNGTTEYFSMMNAHVYEFYEELCISPAIRSTWCIEGLDGRQELESLLAVSAYVDGDLLLKNEYQLPVAFCINRTMHRAEFSSLSPLQKESVLVNAVVLEEDTYSKAEKAMLMTDTRDVSELENSKDEQIAISTECLSGETVRVYLGSTLRQNGEYYVNIENFYFLSDDMDSVVTVGNKTVHLANPNSTIFESPTDFWVRVSEFYEDDKGYYFDIQLEADETYEMGDITVYFHQPDYTAIKKLQRHGAENIQIVNNRITMTATAESDEYLFASIPYSTGWTAYVDGVKTPVYQADVGFMAITLEAGEHEVEFRYVTPGLKIGLALSIIGLLIIMFIIMRKAYTNRQDRNSTINEDTT